MSELTIPFVLPLHIEAPLITGTNAVTPAVSLVDQLTPPVGTSFFIKKDFTIIEQEAFSWYVTAHVYVTGANPLEPDFEGKGGQIHVVLVHTGRGIFKYLELDVAVDASPRPEFQLPSTGSGEVQYDNKGEETGYIQFTIHFERTMAMLRNNGLEPFSFNAAYEQVFDRYHEMQTGEIAADSKSVQIIIYFISGDVIGKKMEIYGLSTFRTSNLIQSINLNCEYHVFNLPGGSSPSGSKMCTIPLSFT